MEDAGTLGTKGAHMCQGACDMAIAFCNDCLGGGGDNPGVRATVFVSSVCYKDEAVVGEDSADGLVIVDVDGPLY